MRVNSNAGAWADAMDASIITSKIWSVWIITESLELGSTIAQTDGLDGARALHHAVFGGGDIAGRAAQRAASGHFKRAAILRGSAGSDGDGGAGGDFEEPAFADAGAHYRYLVSVPARFSSSVPLENHTV
jgi:hypothetical protein